MEFRVVSRMDVLVRRTVAKPSQPDESSLPEEIESALASLDFVVRKDSEPKATALITRDRADHINETANRSVKSLQ